MRHFSWLVAGVVLIMAVPIFGQTSRASQPAEGELAGVAGIDEFEGSQGARELLAKNGFVVTDQQFRQIFSAYIGSPMPKFITTDSAWHAYHVMLEEGVKRLEAVQAARLKNLSRLLLAEIRKRPQAQPEWNDLADFVTVGLALQDDSTAKALDANQADLGKLVRTIQGGRGKVEFSIGLPLSAGRFPAVGFYTESPALRGYYAARQWYGAVDFRLAKPRETALAVKLSLLIDGDAKLKALYEKWTKIYDVLVGPADDGDVGLYASVARKVLGGDLSPAAIDKNIEALRKELACRQAGPKVNDQPLSREEYARWVENTNGFRLLPSRQLSCAVCFQNTVDPKIKRREFPSGVDFFAASKELRSPAALRALEAQAGKPTADAIVAATCPPLGESLHGQAMKLLAELQKPVPASAPAALRTEAWADKQLSTQLAAWAEQRHTWAAHAKLTMNYFGYTKEHPGIVSPYPEFFAGLGRLSSATADALATVDPAKEIDALAVAAGLAEAYGILEDHRLINNEMWRKMEKFGDEVRMAAKRLKVEDNSPFYEEVVDAVKRVSAGGEPTERDKTVLALFDSTGEVADMLRSFGKVCDTLAAIARKQLAGEALAEADKKFIQDYGQCLGGYHFYGGNSWLSPRDDFPMLTPIFVSRRDNGYEVLSAGLARPQALYVIVPVDGKPVLHLGAVLTYREFHQKDTEHFTDQAWIERVRGGQVPPPPAFTESFMRGITSQEIISQLRAGGKFEDIDDRDDRDITLAMIDILDKGDYPYQQWLLWHLSLRCTEADVAAMIRLVGKLPVDLSSFEWLLKRTAELPWKAQHDALMKLLHSAEHERSDAAAYILSRRPQDVDFAQMAADFDKGEVRLRRLYCFVMGHQKKPDATVKSTLLKALEDKAPGVRWQAALAFAKAGWGDADIVKALAACLNDKNGCVGAAAGEALVDIHAPDVKALLLQRLADVARTRGAVDANGRDNAEAVRDDTPEGRAAALRVLWYREYSNNIPGLEESLIKGLCQERYTSPELEELLVGIALEAKASAKARSAALDGLEDTGCKATAKRLAALLEDKTVISTREDREPWRICHAAARAIARIEGWEDSKNVGEYSRPQERAGLLAHARKWATSMPATMPG